MNIIHIQSLEIQAYIGVEEIERQLLRPIILQIDLGVDDKVFMSCADDVSNTINYAFVIDCVIEQVNNTRFRLLESLVEHLAAIIFEKFSPIWLKIRVDKPGIIANTKSVGVSIERHRKAGV